MVKVVMRSFLDIPSESSADAALSMVHEWPELRRYVSLDNLSRIYNFEFNTLEHAARELLKRGFLEKRERFVRSTSEFGCSRMVTFYRRSRDVCVIYTQR